MEASVTQFRERMACLADHSRFRIVITLAAGEQCVSAIARGVGLSQSCTTRHLQALQRRGLVQGRRQGREVYFRVCAEEPEIRLVVEAARGSELPLQPPHSETGTVRRKPSAGPPAHGPVSPGSPVAANSGPGREASRASSNPAGFAPAFDRESADDEISDAPVRPTPFRSNDLEDFLL
jgi:DNA-binding transcriptional ArsR family regulator